MTGESFFAWWPILWLARLLVVVLLLVANVLVGCVVVGILAAFREIASGRWRDALNEALAQDERKTSARTTRDRCLRSGSVDIEHKGRHHTHVTVRQLSKPLGCDVRWP